MDLVRSVSKAIVLDADGEDFVRTSTTFTGLADLSDRAWNRVAAAADMPVTILTGQSPAGLQATGASDLRWWYGKVQSEQTQTYEPRVKRILQILLSAQDSEVQLSEQEFKALTVSWKPLWAPSAAELATIQLQWAQAGQIMIQEQMITSEEYVCGAPEEWFPALDREQRREMIETLDVQGQKDEAAQAEADAQAAQTEALRAKAGDGKPRADGSEDQPRDEDGRWSSGGGGSRVGKAHDRLAQAREAHAMAKAEHEAHTQKLHEIAASLDQAPAGMRAAGAKAAELAADAKARYAAQKQAAKEHAKAGRELEKRHEAEQAAHDKQAEALDKRHENEQEAHTKAGDALEARHEAELEAVDEENEADLLTRQGEEAEQHEKSGVELEARQAAEQAAHAQIGDEISARHEAEQEAHDYAPVEPDEDLKDWARDLNKVARRAEKDAQRAERIAATLRSADQDKATRLAENSSGAAYDQIDLYLSDVQGQASGSTWEDTATAHIAIATDGLVELPPVSDSERRLARRERAVRAHEREVKRLSK
jgi:hypothetical protein